MHDITINCHNVNSVAIGLNLLKLRSTSKSLTQAFCAQCSGGELQDCTGNGGFRLPLLLTCLTFKYICLKLKRHDLYLFHQITKLKKNINPTMYQMQSMPSQTIGTATRIGSFKFETLLQTGIFK
ncbi:hypothetical protein CHS0354_040505 [Potamilus streckersoni]|uniref:Uncharacterized protein n=1 Tax=Potamilus streckersoni TaxID=2493646 RepID=A0AAE0WE06_9BIVA|nr:hypothetical protein CHS0354_040505 [Potamilus streckersoni]